MINKQLQEDIAKNNYQDDEEEITGNNCPICNYPTVYEYGLELCYHCGWSADEQYEGYYDE